MGSSPINLNNFKNKKKYAQIRKDLTTISKLFDIYIGGLSPYHHYSLVIDTILVLQTNKSLVETYINNIDKKYGKVEKT